MTNRRGIPKLSKIKPRSSTTIFRTNATTKWG
uniref:Uncharacterized protein n=1 Tax=Rhizophora mucronata TaxID=61149 RepID=A0A2P2QKJ1_RHIMU